MTEHAQTRFRRERVAALVEELRLSEKKHRQIPLPRSSEAAVDSRDTNVFFGEREVGPHAFRPGHMQPVERI